MATDAKHPEQEKSVDWFEPATQIGLIALAIIAALGAILRIFWPNNTLQFDEKTLFYLMVAGGLLLLKQIRTFSFGQLRFELIEKIQNRQDKQEEKLYNIDMILPLLLPASEIKHIMNLFLRTAGKYTGNHALRTELRRLASIGLLSRKANRSIGGMKDGMTFDLTDYVELTELGRRWARKILEIEGTGEKNSVDLAEDPGHSRGNSNPISR